jgi:hypothetical protein
MSKIYADTVEPTVPTKDITLGATGDSITVSGNSINTNVIKDSGGNVLFQSDGSGTLSNVNSAFSNNLKLLSTQTASDSASLSFTSGIDSTYDVYIFKFIDIDAGTGDANLTFQVNASGQTGYNETITSTAFSAYHKEDGSGSALGYQTGWDQAQGTAFQLIAFRLKDYADACASGELYLFNPSSTTYVKHFYSTSNGMTGEESTEIFIGGYINTTSAIDDIQFKMSSGNFNGVIKMYGL